jgi:ribose 1,5-bisphosphate isomerase
MKKGVLSKKEKDRIKKTHQDIKSVKIQGATNIAKAAFKAYLLKPDEAHKKQLLKLRPTEPILNNAINFLEQMPEEKILGHFDMAQKKMNKLVYKILKKRKLKKIYTHCHSTNVIKALIYSKNKGLKFEVYNTETRPLYQGRKTARELSKAKIKVSMFVDSGMHEALEKVDAVFIGADALLRDGVINKIGSEAIAVIAKVRKIPLYVIADSWKFSPKNVEVEERTFKEVWKKAPKKLKVRNPGFEKFGKQYITKVVSDIGIRSYDSFIKKIDKLL